jgi:hypothetical protein
MKISWTGLSFGRLKACSTQGKCVLWEFQVDNGRHVLGVFGQTLLPIGIKVPESGFSKDSFIAGN